MRDDELVPTERYDVVLELGSLPASDPRLEPEVEESGEGDATGEGGGEGLGKPADSLTDLRKIGNLLALGPSADEQATGLTSEVPADLRLSLLVGWADGVFPPAGTPTPDVPVPNEVLGGEAEPIEVVVEEPADRLSDIAAEQIACTLQSYLELIGEDRDIVLSAVHGEPYLDTGR
ncbi:hypothetical protein [Phytoactinopolyspora endophytica]|uniref:hypothetical protein n=1 Tax=Phytoactinopolyspora endophytica TaxID=1642495 RepID=UPI00197BE19A|nr:hypothetical protein [Phytoactinopolyspora endophytica]